MFIKNYTITVNKPYEEAVSMFEANLEDMSKKGYSMSGNTVIYNSDHRLKLFTGEFKNGEYVVRSADSSDMFYRYLPKMKIQFVDKGSQTEINVKSKHIRCLAFFIILMFLTIGLLLMAITLFIEEDMPQILFAPAVVGIITAITAIISTKQLNDGKVALEYIYKNN